MKFYKAMSDETRLRLMALLTQRDYCVCELTEILNLSQPKISKHLAKLRDLGFVKTRRDARFVFYQVTYHDPAVEASMQALLKHLEHYEVLYKDSQKVPVCTIEPRQKNQPQKKRG